MPVTDTTVSRLNLVHPDLGHDGGATLHTKVRTAWTKIGDNMNARYSEFTGVSNDDVLSINHDFGVGVAELRVILYSGTGDSKTRITEATTPAYSDFTIANDGGDPTGTLTITCPSSDTPATLSAVAIHGRGAENLDDLDDVDTSGKEDGQALVYDSGTTSWKPGASGDSSFKLQSITDPNLTLKGGYLILGDGRELATYDSTYGADLTLNLDTIFGSDPVANTAYYLYIDLDSLGTEQTSSGRKLYQIIQSNFYITTTTPQNINLNRYVPIGEILSATAATTWDGTGSAFFTLAYRRHESLSSTISYVEKKVDSATSATTKTVTHGLSNIPQIVKLYFVDDSASTRTELDPSNYLTDLDEVEANFDFSSITFDTSDAVEIVLFYVPELANGVVQSTRSFTSPWYENTSTTSVAHGLESKDDIAGIVVQEWDVTNDRYKDLTVTNLVAYWDDTNITLNWTGLSPSSTLKYRVKTGPTALPFGEGFYGNKFVFDNTGELTSSTTSYPCDKIFGDAPSSLEAFQKTTNGWQKIDNIGNMTWVTADANKYLRGNLDSLTPSVSNPVYVYVK